ncbi:MATE family efflux transporter [Halotalea alkalilenta]|uniref:MATE family efflux transporter n=1 Tax=Halotalea alkalilenta TaxID=376489 RepID=UPI001CBC0138|nr:MATE family efflux transporter [Halotalea alkalilenta]
MPPIARNPLLEGPIFGSLLKLALPIIVANLLQSTYQLIDAFWVGRLGGDAVAAVSISLPINFLAFALGSGFSVAGSTLIAQYVGARNRAMTDHVAGQVLLLAFGFSLLLTALGQWAAPRMLTLLSVEPGVYDDALAFLRITLGGLVFTFGFAMFQALMRGAGEVRIPLYIVLGTVVLNALIDPPLIFGWGPIPAFGVAGAAFATLLTQGLALGIGLWLLARGKLGIVLRLRALRPDWAFIARAFRLGFPSSVELSARALGMNAMVLMVAAFGTVTIAAYGVVNSLLALVIIPALGLSMATSALVGQNIGAGQIERARSIARLSSVIAFIGLSLVGVAAFLAAPSLVAVFVPDDPEVIATGARFLRTVAFTFGLIGLQMSLSGVFRAAGQTVVTMNLALVSQWVIQLPLAWFLSREAAFGVDGLWWAFPLTNLLMAAITMLWYARLDWQRVSLLPSSHPADQGARSPRR